MIGTCAAAILVLALAACTVAAPKPSRAHRAPRTSSPDLSPAVALAKDQNVTVRAYLGSGASLGDVAVRDRFRPDGPATSPFAFWMVDTNATPTASGAAAALLSMAQRYEGRGRQLVLRMDVAPKRLPWRVNPPSIVLFWNPTDAKSRSFGYGMVPGPRSLGVWTQEQSYGIAIRSRMSTQVSEVTTESVEAAAKGEGELWDSLRRLTTLR
jgi:hypothetical protein